MKPQRLKKSPRRPGLAAEPLESRCLLSAAPLSFAPDGAAWITNPTTLLRLGTGTAAQYTLPTSFNAASWTITSAAVFTADNSAWFLLANSQTDAIDRLTPDGHFTTITQQPALQHLAAAGNDVWFTQGANQIGLLTTTGTQALFTIPGLANFSQLAAVVTTPPGTDAAWFAGQSTDGHPLLGSITADGQIHLQPLTSDVTLFTVPALAFNGMTTDIMTGTGSLALFSMGTVSSAAITFPPVNTPHTETPRTPPILSRPAATPSAAAPLADAPPQSALPTVSEKPVGNPSVFEGEFAVISPAPMPLHAQPSPQLDEEEAAASTTALPPPNPHRSAPPSSPAPTALAPTLAAASPPTQQMAALFSLLTASPRQPAPPLPARLVTITPPPAPLPTSSRLPRWTLLAMTIFAGRNEAIPSKKREQTPRPPR